MGNPSNDDVVLITMENRQKFCHKDQILHDEGNTNQTTVRVAKTNFVKFFTTLNSHKKETMSLQDKVTIGSDVPLEESPRQYQS